MALVLGLVAAAARAMSSNDDDRQQNHNYNSSSRNDLYRNPHSHNNGHHSCCNSDYSNNCCNSTSSPYAAYPPQMTGSRRAERRMERKMRKAERKARNTDMLLSLMSGSRGASGSTGLSGGSTSSAHHHQPVHGGGVPYVGYGDSSRGRDVYPESQRGVASGSGGHQWRDGDAFQGRDRPESSSEALPTYEQAVRRSDKSRR
ncbi:hypothetical protein CCMA1212_005027 [Trichoderma ghanense]|uniref:SSCRP protein n=1 Tax=Trichoderma ghanense TaxID=65468 RepID=A0ABY2H2V1_9HYPO